MTKLTRRAQNRLDKERRILLAARQVFASAGYSGASMDMIAGNAGLTKPTLYSYFPTKAALFEAMMTAERDRMMRAFEAEENGCMIQQLWRFAWIYADTVMHPDFLSLARLVVGESHRFADIGRAYQESGPDKVLAGLSEFLLMQRALGRLSFEDAELAAEDFWGLILSAPRNRALHIPGMVMDEATLSRYINNGIRIFLKAYSAHPADDLALFEDALERGFAAGGRYIAPR